jgi:hypothetical protein
MKSPLKTEIRIANRRAKTGTNRKTTLAKLNIPGHLLCARPGVLRDATLPMPTTSGDFGHELPVRVEGRDRRTRHDVVFTGPFSRLSTAWAHQRPPAREGVHGSSVAPTRFVAVTHLTVPSARQEVDSTARHHQSDDECGRCPDEGSRRRPRWRGRRAGRPRGSRRSWTWPHGGTTTIGFGCQLPCRHLADGQLPGHSPVHFSNTRAP